MKMGTILLPAEEACKIETPLLAGVALVTTITTDKPGLLERLRHPLLLVAINVATLLYMLEVAAVKVVPSETPCNLVEVPATSVLKAETSIEF